MLLIIATQVRDCLVSFAPYLSVSPKRVSFVLMSALCFLALLATRFGLWIFSIYSPAVLLL